MRTSCRSRSSTPWMLRTSVRTPARRPRARTRTIPRSSSRDPRRRCACTRRPPGQAPASRSTSSCRARGTGWAMFRDDELAAFSRVDVLERAVNRLQTDLAHERSENDRLRACLHGGVLTRPRRRLLATPAGAVIGGALVGLAASTVALLLL